MFRYGWLLAAVAVSLAAAPAEAAKQCSKKTYFGGSPHGPIPWINRSGALSSAKGNWEGRVNADMAGTFAVWGQSRNRKTACNRTPNGIGGYNWHCSVQAKPCRYVTNCSNNLSGYTCG